MPMSTPSPLLRPYDRDQLRQEFQSAQPFPHIKIDNFLQPEVAQEISAAYPTFDNAVSMGFQFNALNEQRKVQVTDAAKFPGPVARLNEALASPAFLKDLEYITGIPNLLADARLAGGGMHLTGPGGRLDVHVDFNYDENIKLHRRLNILVYLNPVWEPSWGGEIELWDKDVKNRGVSLLPLINRCLIFQTDETSYHGVSPITGPAHVERKSFAAYYYTKEPPARLERPGPHHRVQGASRREAARLRPDAGAAAAGGGAAGAAAGEEPGEADVDRGGAGVAGGRYLPEFVRFRNTPGCNTLGPMAEVAPVREADIPALFEQARQRRGDLNVSLERFRQRLQPCLDGERIVDAERAADLYLACACEDGHDQAVRVLEREYMPGARSAMARLTRSDPQLDDAMQELRQRLLEKYSPKLAGYWAGAVVEVDPDHGDSHGSGLPEVERQPPGRIRGAGGSPAEGSAGSGDGVHPPAISGGFPPGSEREPGPPGGARANAAAPALRGEAGGGPAGGQLPGPSGDHPPVATSDPGHDAGRGPGAPAEAGTGAEPERNLQHLAGDSQPGAHKFRPPGRGTSGGGSPAGWNVVEGNNLPVHTLFITAMGIHLLDNQDLEAVSAMAAKLKRWEFMLTIAPVPVTGGTGFPLNALATF